MTNKWLEKIDDYLSGRMNSEKRMLFESEMASNEELSSLFRSLQWIENEMRDSEKYSNREAEFKKILQGLSSKYFKKEENEIVEMDLAEENISKVKRINIWKSVAIAAGIIGIISLGIIFYLPKSKENSQVAVNKNQKDSVQQKNKTDTIRQVQNVPLDNLAKDEKTKGSETVESAKKQRENRAKNETLFADNFKPDAAPEEIEGPLEDAFDEYEKEHWKNTITAFERASLNPETRSEVDTALTKFYAHYYKGISYLADHNTIKSITELEKATITSPDSLFFIKAKWYLALAHLEMDNLKKTRELLTQIANNRYETEYQSRAAKLISELEKR